MRARAVGLALWLLASLGALASVAAGFVAALVAPSSRYMRNQLVAGDQAANAAIGGDPDETISSRLGKGASNGCAVCRIVCWALSRFDSEHCRQSMEADEGGDGVI